MGFAALAAVALWPAAEGAHAQQPTDPLVALKARFARPSFVPNPSSNPPTPAKIALGKRIFEDVDSSSLSLTLTAVDRLCNGSVVLKYIPRYTTVDGRG